MLPDVLQSPARKTALLLCGAALCTLTSAVSARRDVRTLQRFQSDVLPSALELPALQRRIEILTQQVEAADTQRALNGGQTEERLRAFVLPAELSRNRIVGFLEAVRVLLSEENVLLDMTTVDVGSPSPATEDGLSLAPVKVTMHIHPRGLASALSALDLAGSFTVGDLLTKRDIELLLILTEQENPAGIVGLEQFLDTDLLTYAREPRLAEDRLLKSFTAPAFATALQSAVSTDRVRTARRLLSGSFGSSLKEHQLWPTSALFIEGLTFRQQTADSVELQWSLSTAIRTMPGA